MIIKIAVYNGKQFKASGGLKKKAQSEVGFTMADVAPLNPKDLQDFLENTAKQLNDNYNCFESPYIFTHLKAKNKVTGEDVFIYETVNDMITSPMKLKELLTK